MLYNWVVQIWLHSVKHAYIWAWDDVLFHIGRTSRFTDIRYNFPVYILVKTHISSHTQYNDHCQISVRWS